MKKSKGSGQMKRGRGKNGNYTKKGKKPPVKHKGVTRYA